MFRKLIDLNGELSVGDRMHPQKDGRRAPDRTFVDVYSRAESEDFHLSQGGHELIVKRKPRRIFRRSTQGVYTSDHKDNGLLVCTSDFTREIVVISFEQTTTIP